MATPAATTKRPTRVQCKNWCFTLQSDPSKGQHIAWPTIKECPVDWWARHEDNGLVYLVCQVEKAPNTGKYHVQGYVSLDKKSVLTTVKRLFSATAHWEPARGTPLENQDYCTKEASRVNGPWTFGVLPQGSGTRSDLAAVYGYIKSDKTAAEILEITEGKAAKFEKHMNFIRFTLNEIKSDRQLQGVRVVVLYGNTGVGKTYAAVNYFGGNDYHLQECPASPISKFWFDGYAGQKTLILDDFSGDFCNFRFFLRLLDKYKMKVEVKGGHSWALWTTVVITTNVHPAHWWTGVNMAPLQRRITEIRLCEHQGTYKLMNWLEQTTGDFEHFVPPAVPAAPVPSTSGDRTVPETQPWPQDPPVQRRRLHRTASVVLDTQDKGKEKDKNSCDSDMTDPDEDDAL